MPFADSTSPPPDWAVGTSSASTPGSRRSGGRKQTADRADRSTWAAAGPDPDGVFGPERRTARRQRRAPVDPECEPRTRGQEPDPHEWARQIVLRLLTNSPKSRHQLELALRKRHCSDEVTAAVLDRMEEVGLVDDTAFAGMLVRSQQAGRGLARRALAHELRTKGVDDETASVALDQIDPRAEEELARALVVKKLRSMQGLERVVQTRRLAGMLARKGYTAETSMRVIREELDARPEHQRD